MELSKETQDQISQLQLFEQKMQSFLGQKQQFQSQLLEIENALKELENSEGDAYKIVGNIMLKTEKNKLHDSLKEREDILGLRLKNITKQEETLKEQAEKIQAEIMKEIERNTGEKKEE
ncbi:MAG: prefoldin subunit beta [Nanoarchaeota archaeon]|nr:prefoldin subunit beta [Nanoarchaeota archaeon]